LEKVKENVPAHRLRMPGLEMKQQHPIKDFVLIFALFALFVVKFIC